VAPGPGGASGCSATAQDCPVGDPGIPGTSDRMPRGRKEVAKRTPPGMAASIVDKGPDEALNDRLSERGSRRTHAFPEDQRPAYRNRFDRPVE
jgi:hypothetical protein